MQVKDGGHVEQVSERVSAHLLDAAANAAEHGDEMLADILRGESHALLDGRMEALIRCTDATASHTVEDIADDGDDVRHLEALRADALQNGAIRAAREQADTIIEAAWLREGHTSTSTVTAQA